MNDSPHLLVVDDDRRIRSLLNDYLSRNGFRVTVAASAAEARKQLEALVFDAIVLDVMMPGESGIRFTEDLRGRKLAVPVLMLSALADGADRIKGLESGSDDYLTKPFEPEELLLRLRNLLRRGGARGPVIKQAQFGACLFDMETGELQRDGVPVRLTGREKDLLRSLIGRAGEPVSRQQLGAPGQDETARAVDVQINRLRQKIEKDPANPVLLQTARGEGYVLFVEGVS
ncbi:MAG: response regulator transcription factor [Hyphomicrobiales bacterium]